MASPPRQVGAGDVVALISLNEGRGEVVMWALVVVFHPGLSGEWMGPGWWYDEKGKRAVQMRKGG